MRKWIAALSLAAGLMLTGATGGASAAGSQIEGFAPNSLTKPDGTYWVWGSPYSVPTQIVGLEDVRASFAGQLAVKKDGTLWRWERKPNTAEVGVYPVGGATDVTAVLGDYPGPLLLDAGGRLYRMASYDAAVAERIEGIEDVTDMTSYYRYGTARQEWLFLKRDGSVWTSADDLQTFEAIPSLRDIVDIETNHALRSDGTVWTWQNEYTDEVSKQAGPIVAAKAEGLSDIRAMTVRGNFKVAIDGRSRVWYWGKTVTGASDGTTYHEQAAPVMLTGVKDAKEAYLIERSLIVLTNDGGMYEASLGGERLAADASFERIASDVARVEAGVRHLIMQKRDGSLWGWGVNKNAELGYGDFEFMHAKPVPVQAAVAVKLNGEAVALSNGAIVKNGQAFIPIRSIFERLGAAVEWDFYSKLATVKQERPGEPPVEIRLDLMSGEVTLNGAAVAMPNKPFINSGVTYLPLRFVSEELGATVDWSQETQSISIAAR